MKGKRSHFAVYSARIRAERTIGWGLWGTLPHPGSLTRLGSRGMADATLEGESQAQKGRHYDPMALHSLVHRAASLVLGAGREHGGPVVLLSPRLGRFYFPATATGLRSSGSILQSN